MGMANAARKNPIRWGQLTSRYGLLLLALVFIIMFSVLASGDIPDRDDGVVPSWTPKRSSPCWRWPRPWP